MPRRPLCDLVDRLADVRLATVAAPAGCGKSTLLRYWLEELREAGELALHLELSPIHADVAVLVADLVEGLRAFDPRFGGECNRELAEPADDELGWQRLLRAFQRDCRDQPPTFVMLDGYQAIPPDSGAERFLSHALRGETLGSIRWIVASRGALPAATLRLRAAEATLEVSADDLNLRYDEIRSLLLARGIELDEETLTRLLAETDGWVAGVLLVARRLATLAPEERTGYLTTLAAYDDLFDYVAGEALTDESDEMIALLEWVSLFDSAQPRDLAAVGMADAVALCGRAVSQGLLERSGDRYTLHPLWRALLLARRRQHSPPEVWRAQLGEAARVLEADGRREDALELRAEAEDEEGLADALVIAGGPWFEHMQLARARPWLDRLSEHHIEARPELLWLRATSHMRDRPAEAEPILARAQALYADRGDTTSAARIFFWRALLLFADGQLDGLRVATRGLLRQPGTVLNREFRGLALVGLAGWALITGRYARGLRFANRATRYSLPGPIRWTNAILRSQLLAMSGDYRRALEVAEGVLDDPELQLTSIMTGSMTIARGMLRVMVEDTNAGIADLEAGLESLARYRWLRVREIATRYLAFGHYASGHPERALDALRTLAEGLVRAEDESGEIATLTQLALIELVQGNEEAASAAASRAESQLGPDLGHPRHVLAIANAVELWWVRASLGDASSAWQEVQRRMPRSKPWGLPLFDHISLLYQSEIARLAGEAESAGRLARRAWEIAAEARLQWSKPIVGHLISARPGLEALRAGVAPDYVFERLRVLCPDALPELLIELYGDRAVARRVLAVELMGRLGGRGLHEPLTRATADRSAKVRSKAEAILPELDLRPSHRLAIRSLGALEILRGGSRAAEEEWRGGMSRRLLGRLLCSEGQVISRDRLLADLWPDATTEAARSNLRVALHRLNAVLDPERPASMPAYFVQTRGDTLQLRAEGIEHWDVMRIHELFEEAATASRRGEVDLAIANLREAFELYRGPFLPDLLYEEWTHELRADLAEAFRREGIRLAELLLASDEADEAQRVAARLRTEDPTHEAATGIAMRAALARGEPSEALRHYERCRAALATELEVEPGREIQQLASLARAGGQA